MAAGVSAAIIALGEVHTCAILAGGGVKCWGGNNYGQLGIGSTSQQNSPVTVSGAGRRGGRAIHTYIHTYIIIYKPEGCKNQSGRVVMMGRSGRRMRAVWEVRS